MKVKLKRKAVEFLENSASIVTVNKNQYFYMPYWFKRTKDPTIFEELSWDELPKELIDTIESLRKEEKP